ncbi:hypothetical protein [Rhizobium leguminosarum]|uniref:hypothetical protein n=1 Tax=Rhizobium leguminosarum TaxID=384 RepID=UPI002E0FC5B4|nr:hypothetical protein U8Q02_41060 [Rhizobium leguminosarum]
MRNLDATPAPIVWRSQHIEEWERKLATALVEENRRLDEYGRNDKAYVSLPTAPIRARKILEALHLCVTVQEVSDGLLLGGKIIVAVTKSKFRIKGQSGWTVYRGGLGKLSDRFFLHLP